MWQALTWALVIACSNSSKGGVAVLARERGCLCQLALAAVRLLCFCVTTARRKEFPLIGGADSGGVSGIKGDSPGWLRAQRSPVKVFWGPRELNHMENEGFLGK